MTICTQQSDVTLVGSPVFEPAAPRISTLSTQLGGWINVVNIQRARVSKPALYTLAAKLGYQGHLAFPLSVFCKERVSVPVPIHLLTKRCAKSRFTGLATGKAFPRSLPPTSKITRLPTEFPSSVFQSVCVNLARPAAILAHNLNAVSRAVGLNTALPGIPGRWSVGIVTGPRAVLPVPTPDEVGPAFGAKMLNCFHGKAYQFRRPQSNFDAACVRAKDPADVRMRDLFREPAP